MFQSLFPTNVRTRNHPGHWQEAVTRFSPWKGEPSILYCTPPTLAAVLRRSAAPGVKTPQTKYDGGEKRCCSESPGAGRPQQNWRHPAPTRPVTAFTKGTAAAPLLVCLASVSGTKAAAQQVLLQMPPKYREEQNCIALQPLLWIFIARILDKQGSRAFPGARSGASATLVTKHPAIQTLRGDLMGMVKQNMEETTINLQV